MQCARNGILSFVAACSGSLLLSYGLALSCAAYADFSNLTTVSFADSPLFQIVTGWNGLSASARAAQMQANLESALNDAPSSASIDVRMLNDGAAALYANNRYIGTADAGDAAALNTTPAALAQTWANSIGSAFARKTIARAQHIQSFAATVSTEPVVQSAAQYLSQSAQVCAETTNASPANEEAPPVHFVALPAGLALPVYLSAPTSLAESGFVPGATIEARTARDVILPESNKLSKGTRLFGQIVGDEKRCRGGSCLDVITINFDTMVLADGTRFPISSQQATATVSNTNLDKPISMLIQLNERAQIAVSGSVL